MDFVNNLRKIAVSSSIDLSRWWSETHNVRDAVQIRVSPCVQPSQKHSRRAEHQLGVGASTTLSADGVTNATNCSVNILESFLRDSGSDSESGDSTRLSDHDGRRATSKVGDLVI